MIEFSKHALLQIKRRNISKRLVITAIKDPKIKEASYRHRSLRRRTFGDKMLEVVTVTEGSKIVVVTAYFSEEKDED